MMNHNSKTDHDFDVLLEVFYRAWFRYHPYEALECGQGHADKLKPFGKSDMGALLTLHDELLSSLEAFNYQTLSVDYRIDFDLLIAQVYLERQQMLQFDWRFRDPQEYLPLLAIDQLLNREVPDFSNALSARLQAIPDYLDRAKQLLAIKPQSIVSLWHEQSLQAIDQAEQIFDQLRQHPKTIDWLSQDLSAGRQIDQASKAVVGFGEFLSDGIGAQPQAEFGCGAHRFNKLLQLQHGLDIDHRQLYRFGQRLFDQTSEQLKQVCFEIAGHQDVKQLSEQIARDHPSKEDLLSEYQQSVANCRQFVVDNDLVSMPKAECLDMLETPEYLQHQIPFAAYYPPALNDVSQRGIYYLTPCNEPQALMHHHRTAIALTSVHEAYPGHHLQFSLANTNPVSSTWPRLINSSATMYEGWALYCEDLMCEQGFLSQPLSRFVMLKDRLWRALRVLIDVDIHVNQLSAEKAAQKMVDTLAMSDEQAKAEIAWYSHSPTVPMSYALGWAMIDALRSQQQARPDFNLKAFHDKLLASGSIPLIKVIQRQFGQQSADQVLAQIFAR